MVPVSSSFRGPTEFDYEAGHPGDVRHRPEFGYAAGHPVDVGHRPEFGYAAGHPVDVRHRTEFDYAAGHPVDVRHRPTEKFGPGDNKAAIQQIVEKDLLDERYAQTKRGLKSRHAQMMALGGTIGTGLFVNTGQTLATGGPAFLFGSYVFMACMVYCIVTAIAEIATYLPIHGGSMSYYGFRYVSRSMGFALGWLYWYAMGMLVPNEITAAALVIDYWQPGVHIAVWITIMLIVIIGLNTLPVRWYGETEFWFCSLKVITLIGLLMLSVILFWGGGPDRRRLGFHYWKHPGPSKVADPPGGETGRFVALLQTLILSAFSFIFAPELVVVSAGEMESPRYNVPRASRRYFFRLIFFYILGVLSITVICPSTNKSLTSGGAGAGSSPFVIGIKNAGIPVLDSIVNAVILTSAWSSGNTFVYMSSRTLYSLAVSGNAPSIFKSCNRYGLPYIAVAVTLLFAPLTYLSAAKSRAVVFNWFVHLTNTSGLTSWICCCIIYIRFRKATFVQGVDRPYKSMLHPVGIYVALVGAIFLLLINGFYVFLPGQWSTSRFFTAYVGIPIFLALYFGHRIIYRNDPWAWDLRDIDLHTGLAEVEAAERPPPVRDTWWKKLMVIIE